MLLFSYDSLEENNSVAIDSINSQRFKINALMEKVEKLDKKSKKDWRQIYKLKKKRNAKRNNERLYTYH